MLNLFTILVSGAGVFAILLKYDVPQLNSSFWGENPYAIKRDIIENVLTWVFIVVALAGLLIQTYSIIFGHSLSERLHDTSFYIKVFISGALVMILAVYTLGFFGKVVAKKIWLPVIIEKQANLYDIAKQIIDNNGFLNEQLPTIDSFSEEKRNQYSQKNFENAERHITQIEELLDIKNKSSNRKERISRLSKYFNKNSS